jgi:hypothetical protein
MLDIAAPRQGVGQAGEAGISIDAEWLGRSSGLGYSGRGDASKAGSEGLEIVARRDCANSSNGCRSRLGSRGSGSLSSSGSGSRCGCSSKWVSGEVGL